MIKSLVLAIAIGLVGGAACSSKSSAPPPPPAGSATAGSAAPAGPPAPGQPGHGSALVGVMAGSDMPACVPDGVRLPKDFPSAMPLPDGVRALSSQPWSDGALVRFAARSSLDDTWTFFTKELPGKGFTLGKSARDQKGAEVAFSTDAVHGVVAIGALAGCPDVLEVQIMYAAGAPGTVPGKK
jgi:hypothetical protein